MRTFTHGLFMLFLVLGLCTGCVQKIVSPTPVPVTQTPTFTITPSNPSRTPLKIGTYLDQKLTRLTENSEFSGVAFVALEGEILLEKAYGLADRANSIPNTTGTQFCIASLTKQFTAMAILLLQNQGNLNVQDPFCSYYNDCPNTWQGITIHQLLTHTSGIPNFTSLPDYPDIALTPVPQSSVIARFHDLPLDFVPGEIWSYSNSGYVLLGAIIEQVSGTSYADFLEQNVFSPLGMMDSGLSPDPARVATGYVDASLDLSAPVPPDAVADGGIFSTVEDLYRWDQALYTELLVPQALLDQMFTAQVAIPESDSGYGYGWEITQTEGHSLYIHTGNIDGFKAYIGRLPDHQLTVILLLNQHDLRPRALGNGLVSDVLTLK